MLRSALFRFRRHEANSLTNILKKKDARHFRRASLRIVEVQTAAVYLISHVVPIVNERPRAGAYVNCSL